MKMGVVKIVNKNSESGFCLINEQDFNPKEHELFEPKVEAKADSKPEKKATKKRAKK